MKLYQETQNFKRPEAYLLTGFFGILSMVNLIRLFLSPREPFDLLLAGNSIILLSAIGIFYFLRRLRLKMSISEKSIKYRLYPFHRHMQKIRWEDVETAQVVEVPLDKSLSGWEVHFSLLERRISLCGDTGLSLHLKNGDNILLGSRHPAALRNILTHLQRRETQA